MKDEQVSTREETPERQSSTAVGLTFLTIAAIASVGAIVSYWLDANTQVFGGLVALSLLAGGAGLVAWARAAMPDEPAIDERGMLESSEEDRAAFAETFVGGEQSIGRRRLLEGSLVILGGGLAATALSLARSLGPDPLPLLRQTAWGPGVRLVTSDGKPVHVNDLGIDGVLTVFPEGHVGAPDGQTLLIRVRPDLLRLPSDRQAWVEQGLVAYSKICTHAGCPVGLYQTDEHLLLCPCHQSTFDVLHGAKPTSGPAVRSLPQLPLAVDEDDFLIAQSDYLIPVGPGYWNL